MKTPDPRLDPRVTPNLPVHVWDERGARLGYAVDLSLGGLLLVSGQPMAPSAAPREIALGLGDAPEFRILVEVRRSGPSPIGVGHESGLRFLALDEDQRHHVYALQRTVTASLGDLLNPTARSRPRDR